MAGDSTAPEGVEPDHPVLKPERTLALVLGASEWPEYPEFHAAPSFRRSAFDIVDYLLGSNGLKLTRRNVKVFFDAFEDAPEILRQIRSFIRERRKESGAVGSPVTDLLLYYVGHGGITFDSNSFFLAICSTHEDDPLATSITAELLGRLIREGAVGLRTYLVLDCCFAASVTKVFMSGGPLGVAAVQLRDRLPPQGDSLAIESGKWPEYGTALLCASGSSEPAKAPPDLPHTMFTGGLLDVLRNGGSSAPLWLSLDDMQRLVRARLQAQFSDNAVLPQVHAPQQRMGRVDLVPLFRKRRVVEAGPPKLKTVKAAFTPPPELPFSSSASQRELTPPQLSDAQALYNKGFRLGALGRSKEAIAVYNDLLARFGSATEAPIREAVAMAFRNKGFRLGALGRGEEEIAVYNDLLARFGSATEAPIREHVAGALNNKGVRLGTLGRGEEEIAVYNDLLARFGSATEAPIREQVAMAFRNKGFRLGALGRGEEEIAVYNDLLTRFGSATEAPIREHVAVALNNKGVRLGTLGRGEEAIAVYNDLLARFGSATEAPIREEVAKALINKGRLIEFLTSALSPLT